jgi:hypothetical protein
MPACPHEATTTPNGGRDAKQILEFNAAELNGGFSGNYSSHSRKVPFAELGCPYSAAITGFDLPQAGAATELYFRPKEGNCQFLAVSWAVWACPKAGGFG